MTDSSDSSRFSRTTRIDIIRDAPAPKPSWTGAPKTVHLRRRTAVPAQPSLQRVEALGGPDFQELMQQSYDAALVTDSKGVIAESNARATEFLGCSRQEFQQKNIDSIISGWNPNLLATVQQTLENDRYVLLQAYCARHDGTLFPGEIAIIRLHVSGRFCFCFFIRDITLRKQTENRLRIGFNAIENAGDAILIADTDGVVEYANPAAASLWQKAHQEELTGKNLLELLHDPLAVEEAMRAVSGRQTWSGELLALRGNEEEFHVRISVAPNVDEDNEWIGAVLSIEDINERKRTERKLHKTLEDLARSNADLQEFAYVASHDLQEPLRKITIFSDLLRRRAADALTFEAAGHLGQIESSAKRMSVLIQGILELSRVSTQGHGFRPVDLSAALQDIVSDFELRIQETGASIEIGPLPVIDAERIQIQQLFQNLFSNALKFRRSDVRLEIKVYSRELEAPADESRPPQCEIVVEDNGIGFDPSHADRIFGVFQRLHSREEYEGTGIGLAVCRKIARRHGGDIRAESQPGAGARFIVTLPLQQAPSPD